MYRAAILRALRNECEYDSESDLAECLRQALDARGKDEIYDWFDEWPEPKHER
jgi:hypothetical protein